MIPALDFRIFGSGHGFAAPYFDQPFYWLSGEFYTFMHGHGAQLHSVQWTHPKAHEVRVIRGVSFRPFSSRRRWGRVMVAWCTNALPRDINGANEWLRQFESHLCSPIFDFQYRAAQVGGHPQGGDYLEAPAPLTDAVAKGHAPNPPHPSPNTPSKAEMP